MTRSYVYDRNRSGQVSEKHRRGEIQLLFLDEGLGKCLKLKIICILQEKTEGKKNEYGNNKRNELCNINNTKLAYYQKDW
jgi:hypothetical protein